MSMPEIPTPNPHLTKEQALTMILSSIALEEVALSHIINAEGEKIQYILGHSPHGCRETDVDDILAVNKSVTGLLEMVMQNQLILKNKMEKVLEYLPKPPPPIPPKPPKPPCPPPPPCPPIPPIPPIPSQSSCFVSVSGEYSCGSCIQWMEEDRRCKCAKIHSVDCAAIQLPRNGVLDVRLCMELSACRTMGQQPGVVELLVDCGEKRCISKLFRQKNLCGQTVISGRIYIQMPCSCSVCHARIIARTPLQLQRGEICFDPVG